MIGINGRRTTTWSATPNANMNTSVIGMPISTTEPEAKLYKKGKGREAKLSYIGNVMTENRNGFVVEAELRQVSGSVEREAAAAMIVRHSPGAQRITVGRRTRVLSGINRLSARSTHRSGFAAANATT